MVDVRRRKLAIIAMNVSVLAAALSWLLVVFSLIYSADAVPWAFGVAIVLSVIGAYAAYRYYSEYSHVLPIEDPVTICIRPICRICTTSMRMRNPSAKITPHRCPSPMMGGGAPSFNRVRDTLPRAYEEEHDQSDRFAAATGSTHPLVHPAQQPRRHALRRGPRRRNCRPLVRVAEALPTPPRAGYVHRESRGLSAGTRHSRRQRTGRRICSGSAPSAGHHAVRRVL